MSQVVEAPVVDLQPIELHQAGVESIVNFTRGLTITTDAEAQRVTDVLAKIARKRKEVKEGRLKITRPLDEAKKAALDLEKSVLGPLEEVDQTLRRGLEAYHVEQERKRREEQERIERERREAEEKARKEAEAAEREARRLDAEAAKRKTDEARERQEAAAEEARQKAEIARQEELVAAQAPVPAVPEAKPLESASGSAAVAMVWQAEVTDPDLIPRKYLKVDQQAINRAMREGVNGDQCSTVIPGVEIKQVPRARVSAK